MFCPKCAAQNLDDAKFCRACGADIRFVPQALAGQLAPVADDDDDYEEGAGLDARGRSRVERGVKKLVTGVGFLLVFLLTVLYFRGGFWITFWFVFPAISNIGAGVGLLAHHASRNARRMTDEKQETKRLRANATSALTDFRLNEIAPADTAEIVAPPASVTEGTTRHLDAVAERPPDESLT